MMNETQTEAFKAIVNYLNESERRHFISEGEPDDHIYRASMVLKDYIDGNASRQPASPPNGEYVPEHPLGQAGPIGIVRDHPRHGEDKTSQGESVVDRGSREIEQRWAKETIGLVAVELNEAYAQFDTSRDNGSIPTGALCNASRRLEEALQRLGLTDEIPF